MTGGKILQLMFGMNYLMRPGRHMVFLKSYSVYNFISEALVAAVSSVGKVNLNFVWHGST